VDRGERGEREDTAPDAAGRLPRVEVLITAHDRMRETLSCLEHLSAQSHDAGAEIGIVLVDDASTDGTAAAVRQRFPEVRLVEGSGQLYWSGGMRLALQEAMRQDPEYYLLLNDDTHLRPGALGRMVSTHLALTRLGERRCILVGSTLDPRTQRQSYGGWRRGGRLHPARLQLVEPGSEAKRCDTMNGNCVLIPRDVVRRVGNLDATFTHSMGDLDYGFRAGRAGCSLWVAPGYVAECVANSGRGLWVEPSLGGRELWRRLVGPKGLPPSEWLVFTYRHYGPFWPAYFAWPYVKNGCRAVARWLGGRA
jgi:GT2 family glycosyltransferase